VEGDISQSSTPTCANCGAPIAPDVRFCTVCGAQQPAVPVAPTQQVVQVPWSGWEALGLVVLTLVISAIFGFLMILFLPLNTAIAASVVFGELLTLLVVIAWVRGRFGLGIEALGWRKGPIGGHVGSGVLVGLLGIALQVPASIIVLWLARLVVGHSVEVNQLSFKGEPTSVQWVLVAFGAVVLAPIAEELLFRGFFFQAVRKWAGPVAAAALSATVFALAHISPLLFLPIGVLGFLLARLFDRRGSILASMVGHATFNLFGIIVLISRSN
jgi:membrane protease YdiL (CAAX protease family)